MTVEKAAEAGETDAPSKKVPTAIYFMIRNANVLSRF